ncbi:amidohydrolase [Photobacterium kasasachensis]|uniref:amidohydrolase n=1 Tax=Photobacterium kasasachensis TaxID=2910240 RepID=UPI003D0B5C2A
MNKLTNPMLLSALVASAFSSVLLATESDLNSVAYINGNIYTGAEKPEYVRSLIITDGVFTYVGNDALQEIKSPEKTKIVDLQGMTVVPGLYDSHIHPVGAGEKLLFECSFPQEAGLDEILSAVKGCVSTIPQGSWIVGGSWGAELFTRASAETLAKLDKVSNGRPVVLTDFSHHNVWANSAAMAQAGISQDYVKQYGELVKTDTDGSLTGFFIEQAGEGIHQAIPARSDNDYKMAAHRAITELNKVGIIGVKDSYVFEKEYKAWKQLDDAGMLTANVALSWGWPTASNLTQAQKQKAFEKMVKPSSGHLNAKFAKMTLDGIPPTKTAAMLAPYNPGEIKILGTLNYSETLLATNLMWLDKNGFTTQVHAVGDRAARTMLNAVEKVRQVQGDSGLRHEIAHACIVDPADIKRFSELNVVPNFSPIFWYPSPIQSGLEMVLGKERATRNCEMKTLTENGSLPTGGSDWPVSADVNPWKAMESMVTRKDPNGQRPDETLWPEQRITIEQAIQMYTINGAMAQRIDDKSGSIEVGKSADMLILSQDVFNITPDRIGETEVQETIFEGKTVYSHK